jgi:hypothetical protein
MMGIVAVVAWAKGNTIPGWTSLVVAFMSIQSITLVIIGILGAYVGKVYSEVQHRPRHLVRTRIPTAGAHAASTMRIPSVIREEPAPKPAKSRFGWLAPVSLTLILLACYAPVLLARYGFCDDYALLGEGVQGGTELTKFVVASGRPTYAALLFVAFHSLGSIDDLVYLRLVGVLGLSVLACCLYLTLRRAGWNKPQAFCLSLIVATMPTFQVYVGWATTAFFTWAGVASASAWHMAERANAQPQPGRKWICGIIAVLMLVVAITIHQSAAMIFWVFVAIGVFRPGVTPSRAVRQMAWHGIIMLSALAIGFVLYKFGMAIFGKLANEGRSGLTIDPIGKLRWFMTEPLVNALGFADLFPRRRYAMLVALLIGGGLLCYFRGPIRQRLQLAVTAAALIPLSYLPNLLVSESWASYRTIAGLTGLCVVYAFLALQGYCTIIPWYRAYRLPSLILACAAIACTLLASWQVQVYFACPQVKELEWVRRQMRQNVLAQASSVYLIRPHSPEWQGKRYDEFGQPSTCQEWVPKPLIYLVLSEIEPQLAGLPVEHVGADSHIDPPPSAVVVDMRDAPLRQ